MNFSEPFDSMPVGSLKSRQSSCADSEWVLDVHDPTNGSLHSEGRACRRRLLLAHLSGHAMQHEHIFMCSTIYPGFSSMWSVGFYQVLCTAPFTPASLSVQHHALSWQKGSSFEHKALLHSPYAHVRPLISAISCSCNLQTSLLCSGKKNSLSIIPHACNAAREKKIETVFPWPIFKCLLLRASWLLDPAFSGVLIDNLSRLVLADVRFACLIYIYACIWAFLMMLLPWVY